MLRKFKLWLADQIFGSFSRFIHSEKYEANLILRLDGKIGDAVTSTGFLREIKLQNPNEKLIVLVNGSQKEVFKGLKYIDKIIDINEIGFFKSFLKLRKINFRYIICTTHILKPKMIFMASWLKAFQKITFSNPQIKAFSHHIEIDFIKDHITDRYKKTLKAMKLKSNSLSYEIQLNSKYVQKAQELFLRAGITKAFVLNSFAGARDRNLSSEKTIEIVQKILETFDVFVISIASREDGEKIEKWMKTYSHPRWKYFSEFDTLEKNCALVSQCDLLTTPDTAWVHIASALKVKLIAFFREDRNPQEINSTIWAPYETVNKILRVPGTTLENLNTNEVVLAVKEVEKR